MKKLLKRILANCGYKISRTSSKSDIPNDTTDAFEMQKRLIKDCDRELVIFDVGAFVGSIALKYNALFPKSKIFCFEPFSDSFLKLKQNMFSYENIITINKGLSDTEGPSKFQTNKSAATNSIFKTHELGEGIWGKGLLDKVETVDVILTTLDSFVKTNAIENIDILKLDVQGAEFMVLNGAKKSFKKGIVNMIYTEIIMLPTYEGQIPFDETIKLIRSYGFELYNFYNYSFTDSGQLRQVDAIFIKSKLNLQS